MFELPLAIALDADRYRVARHSIRGVEVDSWELSFGQHTVWGATAGMLANLCDVFGGRTVAERSAGGHNA